MAASWSLEGEVVIERWNENPFCRRGQRVDPDRRADHEYAAALRTLAVATSAEIACGALSDPVPDSTKGCGITEPVAVPLLLAIAEFLESAKHPPHRGDLARDRDAPAR